jgi:hypothetical protein
MALDPEVTRTRGQGFRAAAREWRWAGFFLLYLVPLALAVGGLNYLLTGSAQLVPSAWLVGGAGGLLLLLYAGLRAGPENEFGYACWLIVLSLVTAGLILRIHRDRRNRRRAEEIAATLKRNEEVAYQARLRVAPWAFEVKLVLQLVGKSAGPVPSGEDLRAVSSVNFHQEWIPLHAEAGRI